MPKVFGYEMELPPDDWHREPITDRQRMAIEKVLTRREIGRPFWRPLVVLILTEAGRPTGTPFRMDKGQASMVLDFYINAEAGSKKLAEKRLATRVCGQQELF